ncbi:MAG: mechanosensitive ion channel [Deltaproteobacteria bacterium]|nr:mechanosensitive ion channel [Deltaproteobacteria bacterium]
MKVLHAQKLSFKALFVAVVFFVLAAVIRGASHMLGAEGAYANVLHKAFIFLATIGTVFLLRWLLVDTPQRLLKKYTVAPLIRTLVSLVLFFGAVMFLLSRIFNIDLLPLLTTSAVITGIIALSLQDTFKNLFTGFWINTERIVAKGDWVRVDGREGIVIEVTWRMTHIMTRENDVIHLPNRLVADGVLENYTYPTKLHVVEVRIGAGFNDPPNKVKETLLVIARDVKSVLSNPAPEVWILGYEGYYVHYSLRVWISDFKDAPDVKTELNTRIWYGFKRNMIEIPFPEQTLHRRPLHRPEPPGRIINALKGIEFLGFLKEDELKDVASSARIEDFGRGETIVRQGDAGHTCYFLEAGGVEVFHRTQAGADELVATLFAGDFFGEMSLLAGEPRSATVAAKEDCRCIVIDSDAFISIFKENPGVAERLSVVLAKRTTELNAARLRGASRVDAEKEAQRTILNEIKRFFKIGV